MVLFPLQILERLQMPITMVLGYQADEIKKIIDDNPDTKKIKNISYVIQPEPLGTGNAVLVAKGNFHSENILILNGDVPLLSSDLIKKLIEEHKNSDATISFISTHAINPSGYGRVVEKDGKVAIYEEKDCPSELRDETQVNAGVYLIKRKFLEEYINKLEKSNTTGEFYLTDLVACASDQKKTVKIIPAPFDEVRGVNSLQELWAVEQIMRSNIIKHWMKNGVRFDLAQNIHVDIDVAIGADSRIGSGVHLFGKTEIGEGVEIGAFSVIENTIVGDDTRIFSHSVIQDSTIGKDVEIGPFARLRNNVIINDNVIIGNFVEMKNSQIGCGSKTKHLSYVGDSTVGQNVNIGAGTIVCNYDGKRKHRTIIEDNAFIGSNNTLVAPIKIGNGAYVAAGSTITNDVPSKDLAIARARQENKKKYVEKLQL
jgi:bifunctional UDP-N-acetylglucosamine pyrophosphorylase/glucosamine-1-phosphate N-acetyltransferase